MEDVSSNENINEENFEDVSSNDIPEHIPDDQSHYEEYISETQTLYDTGDYSAVLADISSSIKFLIAITIGFLLVVCFITGWKHNE